MRPLLVALAGLGGALWTWTVVRIAVRPWDAALGYRPTLDLHPTMLASFVLIALAATLWTRARGRLGVAAIAVAWFGVVLMAVNVAFIITYETDEVVWPTHYFAIFLVALATTLLGAAALRERSVHPGVAMLMLAAGPAALFANVQDDRIWLLLPLGASWLGVAGALAAQDR